METGESQSSPIIISKSMSHKDASADSEFQPILDQPTIPISVQIEDEVNPCKFYLHPKCRIPPEKRKHETFKAPFVLFDYYDLKWEPLEPREKLKNYHRFNVHIFYSYKDIQFLFEDFDIYRKYVLPYLGRTRRISSRTPIALPWKVYKQADDGKMRWHTASINIIDISAMQGSESLDTYAKNVNIQLEKKHTYTQAEKEIMEEQYPDDPYKFEGYGTGDTGLIKIKVSTNEFYNEIAKLIGVETRESWGMSTGKIVASLATAWLAKQIGIDPEAFYYLTTLAGSKGITYLSKLLRNRKIIFAAMVDGGRAVRERDTRQIQVSRTENNTLIFQDGCLRDIVHGHLVDIDIAGCYGNGLRNQKFAIGNPTIIDKPLKLREFLKKYKAQLIPGLYTLRVSWENAPFKQDLLITKTEEAFSTWDMGWEGDEDGFFVEDYKNVYDAAMVLTTNSVTNATLTHDGLQVLQNYASNLEWKWILDNATVDSAVAYFKKHRVNKVTPKMLEGIQLSSHSDYALKASKHWIQVDMAPLLNLLLDERKCHPKKTPMNTFLKLIINTIYGVCASEFFSEKGTGISNVVVGNNITARARILAWCMAKGLHTYMSITDGGVFDINKVLKIKNFSLNLLEGLHRDKFATSHNRAKFVEQVPLMGVELNESRIDELAMMPAYCEIETKNSSDARIVDLYSWQHLKETFSKLDIFKDDQFSFESKNWYVKLTIHSKVDYRLVKANGKKTIALRGMPKVWDEEEKKKVVDPRSNQIFDAIEIGKPKKLVIEGKKLLSQADWEKHPRKDVLLPHDTVSDVKTFYSHTPLALRCKNLDEKKRIELEYTHAKLTGDPIEVAAIWHDMN